MLPTDQEAGVAWGDSRLRLLGNTPPPHPGQHEKGTVEPFYELREWVLPRGPHGRRFHSHFGDSIGIPTGSLLITLWAPWEEVSLTDSYESVLAVAIRCGFLWSFVYDGPR